MDKYDVWVWSLPLTRWRICPSSWGLLYSVSCSIMELNHMWLFNTRNIKCLKILLKLDGLMCLINHQLVNRSSWVPYLLLQKFEIHFKLSRLSFGLNLKILKNASFKQLRRGGEWVLTRGRTKIQNELGLGGERRGGLVGPGFKVLTTTPYGES